MSERNRELTEIVKKFSESGWDAIDSVSKEWLERGENEADLIEAVKKADSLCGSCGCEFDPLYKKALALLGA